LAVSFIKYFGAEILGTVGRKNLRDETAITSNGNGEETNSDRETLACDKSAGEEPIVNESQRAPFKALLIEYFSGVEKHLVEDHQVSTIYFYFIFISYLLYMY